MAKKAAPKTAPKTAPKAAPKSKAASGKRKISESAIRKRAEEIYQRRTENGIPGDADSDWRQAEEELMKSK